MYAVRYQNDFEIINQLVKKGAYIRVRNKHNATPLLLSANYSENPEILSFLMKNRSVTEDEVFKAFIFALTSSNGSDFVKTTKVRLFIEQGIQVNRIWKGKTPLMYAAQFGTSNQVIQLLLDSGAKPGLNDAEGKTAFDYARENLNLERDNTFWALNSSAR